MKQDNNLPVSIYQDNSGVIDPVQIHEFLHEIVKFKGSPNPISEVEWADHVCSQLFTDKPNDIDHICDDDDEKCDRYPKACPVCSIYVCRHNMK